MRQSTDHVAQNITEVPGPDGQKIAEVSFGFRESPKLVRDEILDTASGLINGDRRDTYGDAKTSFDRIAGLWAIILDHPVTAADVARCMVAMKLARLSGSDEHRDSWVDIAGYAALGAEVAGA